VTRTDHVACDGRVFADIAFDDVMVESDARLDCDARQVLEEAETLYALLLAAESLGILQTLVPMSTRYLAERRQFGRPLIEFQVLQHRLADMHIASVRAESAHLLARFKCDELGLVAARAHVAIAKAMVGQCGREVGQQAVQLHGGIGMTEDLVVGHYLKRLTANELLGGHTQFHLENAARLRGVVSSHP
ncbi:MAG TPA: acyl-CoA dehydrogenase family protein, partial [Gammaproteobacteria bacterium]|nr:acyl-CoA dehydrogenase family protein [Gammaproteobacteria bacterium]